MTTSLERLKRDGLNFSTIREHLPRFLFDKGYGEVAERLFALPEGKVLLSQLIGQFLLHLPLSEAVSRNMQQFVAAGLCGEGHASYFGTLQENAAIFLSLSDRGEDDDPFRDTSDQLAPIGKGVSPFFSLRGFSAANSGIGAKIARVPITFLGAGPATILLARTLIDAGFRTITVIDPSGEYGGIWRQKNVRQASRNNPAPMMYETVRVEAAPGDGEHITQFLAALATPPRSSRRKALPSIVRGKVIGVQPGDLAQHVRYVTTNQEHVLDTPLLVAALGQGKPLAPSRPGVMTTDTPEKAGIRWQQQISLSQARTLQGKTVVLIGLGNSCAEMLLQLQRYRDAGLNIRVKVLTHYPYEAIRYPHAVRSADGRIYRLFRDPGEGQLTRLAGDLEPILAAFERVRDSDDHEAEELLTDVKQWSIQQTPSGKQMTVIQRNKQQRVIHCDQLYTLIGYGHPQASLEALGMQVLDPYSGTIATDYDGEVQRSCVAPGRARLYPGYFAAGALLKAPHSENAQVIPGMLYRLPDQFFSIFLRAAEYALLYQSVQR